ncbi:MAG: protein-export chaperone SecB [Rhodospirillaceae bacterium]|jgi:preprotein translocase subunit SecB|nr:protein-export chaperone SecB [Rhodospirillaceae bacterium]
MTDNKNQQTLMRVQVNAQYIKDLSFEIPNAPAIYTEEINAPDVSVHVDLVANPLYQNIYEVVLHLKINAKIKDFTAFIVELSYAGVFGTNVNNEHLRPLLLIECPHLLFPFARNIIANVTYDSGFSPVILQPIDFNSLYYSHAQKTETSAII